jgi:kumamolisin
MLKIWLSAGIAAGVVLGHAAQAQEQSFAVPGGLFVTPPSSVVHAEDTGKNAHTNVHVFYPNGSRAAPLQPYGPYETPGSMACLYGFVPKTPRCNPASAKALPTGGSKVIVIVDAYHDPDALKQLNKFSAFFGLPAVTDDSFQVVFATGQKPPQDTTGGWELEEGLDIEMAHSFAPNAKIILVEAASSSIDDLIVAEKRATKLVEEAGGGEISNSWGATEFAGEDSYESDFTGKNIVYFASTGDTQTAEWPSVLSNVVAVGGTSLARKPNGALINQIAWYFAGAGPSALVPVPSYQSSVPQVSAVVGAYRGVPDVSFVAASQQSYGIWMYDSVPLDGSPSGWVLVAGTSVAAPSIAAIVNRAGNFAASSAAELSIIYSNYTNKADWTDITLSLCGYDITYSASKGYDFCSGVGVPKGYAGK